MHFGRIHIALWLVIIIYWVVMAGGNKKSVQRFDQRKRLVIFIGFIGIAVALSSLRGWPQMRIIPDNDPLQFAAVLLCAAGVALAIWARHILGRNWSANPTIKEGHELITSGPYRFVRHPIYSGILLGLFGTMVIARGRVADLILFGLIAIGLHFKSKIEEQYMLQTFPQSYPEYRRRTKAIIPFVL